jgi:preprotein translocase subunit Sec63
MVLCYLMFHGTFILYIVFNVSRETLSCFFTFNILNVSRETKIFNIKKQYRFLLQKQQLEYDLER